METGRRVVSSVEKDRVTKMNRRNWKRLVTSKHLEEKKKPYPLWTKTLEAQQSSSPSKLMRRKKIKGGPTKMTT